VPGAIRLLVHGEVVDQFGVWDQPTLGTPWELDPQRGDDATRTSTAAQPNPDLAEWTFQR
jgi:hypothetical protein